MRKFLRIFLVGALVLGLSIPTFADDLDDLNARQDELQQEAENSQAKLEELQGSKADIEEKMNEIDAEIENVDALISQYASEASDKSATIDELEETISGQEEDIQDKYDKMKLRIKYMYENLDANYLEAILSSTSFGEFFEKIEYIFSLNNYDRNMMNEIKELKAEVEDNKSEVESQLADVEALEAAQQEQSVVLNGLYDMKSEELVSTENEIAEEEASLASINSMLEENASQIADLSAQYDAMLNGGTGETDPEAEAAAQEAEAEAQRIAEEQGADSEEAQAAQQQAEEARQAAEDTRTSSGGGGTSTGTYMWPLPGVGADHISQYYSAGVHNGIDIWCAEGTPIVAIDGGVVVMARYTPYADTGNYTVIYNGTCYMEYMHQSALAVSEGQTVSQGQVIGYVGNTGNSYGAHLHLSIGYGSSYWCNRVDPAPYIGA